MKAGLFKARLLSLKNFGFAEKFMYVVRFLKQKRGNADGKKERKRAKGRAVAERNFGKIEKMLDLESALSFIIEKKQRVEACGKENGKC